MLKRILSVFLSVVMILTVLSVSGIGALAAAKPTSAATILSWDNGILGIDVTKNSPSYPYVTVTAPAELNMLENPIYHYQNNTPCLGAMFSIASGTLVAGNSYVLSYNVRNNNPNVDATVVAGLIDGTGKISPNNVVTDVITGSEEQTVTRIITLASTDVQTTKTYLRIGLGISNTHNWFKNREDLAFVPNSEIVFDYSNVYFAKEVVYSMTASFDDALVPAGGEQTGSAAVLNQVGQKGTLNQKVTGKVTDMDGNDAEGFTVFGNSDGTFKVSAPANAEIGAKYKVVVSNDTNGEHMDAEAEFTIAEKFICDSEAGTDPLYGIEITADGDYPDALGALGSYIMEAKLTDSNGQVGSNVQSFKWYAVTGDRTELADNFVITPSDDTKTATVKINPAVEKGTYYIIAESTADESLGMLKGFEITVDKSKDIENFVTLLKSDTDESKTKIKDTLDTSLKILDITDPEAASLDADEFIALLTANDEDVTKDNVQEYTLQTAILSLYNSNPKEVSLTGEDGSFKYAEALNLASIDNDKVKIYALLEEVMSSEGLAALQSDVKARKDYESIADFTDEVKEQILLNAIQYPSSLGTGYMEKILTEDNINAVGVDATGYLALDDEDKKAINTELARNEYTLTTLENVLKDAVSPEGGDGGSDGGSTGGGSTGGGSTGGGSRKPGGIGTTIVVEPEEDDKEAGEAPKKQTFTDVPASHWAYSDIYFLREIGAISGVTDDTFNPEGKVTREQFIKMVIDAFKINAKSEAASFEDVNALAWYAPYVATGVGAGITTGKNSKVFGVGEAITRQDVCTMIVRALGMEIPESSKPTFKDTNDIASYAQGAVAVLTEYAVINGFGDNTFRGSEVCTRAQAAKIIAKALNVANVLNGKGESK